MKFDILFGRQAKWIVFSLLSFFALLIIAEYSSLLFPLIPASSFTAEDTSLAHVTPTNALHDLETSSLFGAYVTDDLHDDNVKRSTLDATLVGILLGNSMKESQVIIRLSNGEEKTYRIEEKIAGDAIIKRIMDEGILVEHHGNLERLSLPKNDLIFEPVAKPLNEE